MQLHVPTAAGRSGLRPPARGAARRAPTTQSIEHTFEQDEQIAKWGMVG